MAAIVCCGDRIEAECVRTMVGSATGRNAAGNAGVQRCASTGPTLSEYGLRPKIMAAQFVTPFRKGRRTKNDQADAEVIATASRQGKMRFVPIKSVDQQVRLSWHRVREGYKRESLALSNWIRRTLGSEALKHERAR